MEQHNLPRDFPWKEERGSAGSAGRERLWGRTVHFEVLHTAERQLLTSVLGAWGALLTSLLAAPFVFIPWRQVGARR